MTEVAASDQLLVVIDPVARRHDGEAVRIAKDVLSAGATVKLCLPDGPEEFARALARRGSRRPVVLTGATVIDVKNGQTRSGMTVVVVGKRIAALGGAGRSERARSAGGAGGIRTRHSVHFLKTPGSRLEEQGAAGAGSGDD